MLLSFGAVIVGLAALVWSADRFVDGAAALAHLLGVSMMIIGITIVGFGTSAPEIVVAVIAVLDDTPGLAIGNALGSNIANIGLILGVTALLAPIPVAAHLMRTEYPLLLLATAAMGWALFDLRLGRGEGLVLTILLLFCLLYMIRQHGRYPGDYRAEDRESEAIVHPMSAFAAAGWLLFGLVMLVTSSKLLVWGATGIARELGVSDLVIGLTIVAVGTSLPELAASIASLRKGNPDLAVGNVIGSNLFNSLAVIGIPALVADFGFDAEVLSRDLPVVVGLTLTLLLMSTFPGRRARVLARRKGTMLFAAFVIYQLYLYHDAAS